MQIHLKKDTNSNENQFLDDFKILKGVHSSVQCIQRDTYNVKGAFAVFGQTVNLNTKTF